MSNFNDYWRRLQSSNAGLSKSEKMTISVESFKAQLLKAYKAGAADMAEVGKQVEKAGSQGKRDWEKLFGGLFG